MYLYRAIGVGAVQSNMSVFGAEQNQESNRTSRYFDKYLVAVNFGAIIALSATPFTVNKSTISHPVYIPIVSLLFTAALVFVNSWRFYIHLNSDETAITKCIPVIINAFQTWRKYRQQMNSINVRRSESVQSESLPISHNPSENGESIIIEKQPATFFDYARASNHGIFHDRIVNNVKSLFVPY